MSFHIVIQPTSDYGAELLAPLPGIRQLVAGGGDVGMTIQVPARIGGLTDTARFARSLAAAATDLAQWCDGQTRTDVTATADHSGWSGLSAHPDTHNEN